MGASGIRFDSPPNPLAQPRNAFADRFCQLRRVAGQASVPFFARFLVQLVQYFPAKLAVGQCPPAFHHVSADRIVFVSKTMATGEICSNLSSREEKHV